MPERVVLVHSALGDSRLWRRQVELLRGRGYDAIAPDLPGFGAEPLPTRAFSFVDHLAELLPAILVGNSYGGLVALRTALAHADRVPRLMLVGTSMWGQTWSEELGANDARETELVEAGDLDGATQLNLDFWVRPDLHDEVRPQQRRALELQSGDLPPLEWPEPRPLTDLTMPTLVVVGEHDKPDFHAIGERIAREAADARLEILPRAGHLAALENPDAFDRLLLDFLAGRMDAG